LESVQLAGETRRTSSVLLTAEMQDRADKKAKQF
jgi:hypothetical protein